MVKVEAENVPQKFGDDLALYSFWLPKSLVKKYKYKNGSFRLKIKIEVE